MDNANLISVIIPVFNTPYRRLCACVDSVLTQPYPNVEILLIDDGSSENCKCQLASIANLDERVHIIHKENGGASSARNTGLDRATGKYVTFLDSDDLLSTDFFRSAISCMEKQDLDIVMGGYRNEEAKGCTDHIPKLASLKVYEEDGIQSLRSFFLSYCVSEETLYLRDCPCLLSPWGKLFKRKTVETVRFDTLLVLSEDTIYNLYALDASKRIGIVPDVWYIHTNDAGSLCNRYREHAGEELLLATAAFQNYTAFHRSPDMQTAFYMRVIANIADYLHYDLAHPASTTPHKIHALHVFLQHPPFQKAFQNLSVTDKRLRAPKKYRLTLLFGKWHLPIAIYLLFKLRY